MIGPEQPSSLETRETKIAALREIIDTAIKRGGSHTDAEVRAAIKARLAQIDATTCIGEKTSPF